MPLRIVMFAEDYLPRIGGVSAHVHELSKALIALGHSVVVAQPVLGPRAISRDIAESVPVIRVGYGSGGPGRVISRFVASVMAIRAARRLLGGVDILHQHDYIGAALASNAVRARGAWIWTNHSSWFVRNSGSEWHRAKLRLAFRSASSVIAVSPEIEQLTRIALPEKRVAFVPNGVDTNKFQPRKGNRAVFGIADSDFVIVAPRRVVRKNGLDVLARAWNVLWTRRPDVPWRLLLLGTGASADKDYLVEVRRELAITGRLDRVHELGDVRHSDVADTISISDVVVVPSYIEAISLAALEAMACEKPVVASNVGGLPVVVKNRDTGMLFESGDADGLATALIELSDNVELRSSLAKRGSLLARTQYSWERVATTTVDVYAQSVGFADHG